MALLRRQRKWWLAQNMCVSSRVRALCGVGAQADRVNLAQMDLVDGILCRLQWAAQ
jgi:hypothetical protein